MNQPRFTKSELNSARERRAPGFQVVVDSYEINDGCVDASALKVNRKYFPLAASAVLSDFYKVIPGDEDSALRFVKTWGSLGFESIRRGALGALDVGSDPLAWIWIHANGVRIALDLLRLLSRGDESSIAAYLYQLRLDDAQILAESKVSLALHEWRQGNRPSDPTIIVHSAKAIFMRGEETIPSTYGNYGPERIYGVSIVYGNRDLCTRSDLPHIVDDLPSELARTTLFSIVNPNLRGVFAQLSKVTPFLDEHDGRQIALMQDADSLISVIYRHLADAALAGVVIDCLECGTPFVRRAGRGMYCPPPPWSSSRSSNCYERAKKRQQRAAARAD